VSFAIGPRTTLDVKGRGGPDITDEIGPIDYPDSYSSPARFITDEREFVRDPAAPADPDRIEWYCLSCSWRPWADDGETATVQIIVARGNRIKRVAAVRDGDRWVSPGPLAAGESAYVGRGCARDAYGNYNGAASAVVGPPVPATAQCAAPKATRSAW
jgi:hypothetical protein